jgi:hypothetical protein
LWLSPAYANLPLDKALNKWVTGNPNSDMDTNMQAKNTGYKNAIYAAIGSPEAVQSTLAAAPSSGSPRQAPSSGSPRQEIQVASSGNALVDLFNGYSQYRDEFMKQSGGNTTNVNAPVTNVAQSSSGGGGGNVNPYNTDMMKYLLRPIA